MVTITFHGVVNEIRGNKILIEDGVKIFLDFRKNYSREGIVAYSGDIIMHGAKKGMSEDFIEKATERTQIKALTIFAPFAFFAVEFLCFPNVSQDTNTMEN